SSTGLAAKDWSNRIVIEGTISAPGWKARSPTSAWCGQKLGQSCWKSCASSLHDSAQLDAKARIDLVIHERHVLFQVSQRDGAGGAVALLADDHLHHAVLLAGLV